MRIWTFTYGICAQQIRNYYYFYYYDILRSELVSSIFIPFIQIIIIRNHNYSFLKYFFPYQSCVAITEQHKRLYRNMN